jgi:hypothetical protein
LECEKWRGMGLRVLRDDVEQRFSCLYITINSLCAHVHTAGLARNAQPGCDRDAIHHYLHHRLAECLSQFIDFICYKTLSLQHVGCRLKLGLGYADTPAPSALPVTVSAQKHACFSPFFLFLFISCLSSLRRLSRLSELCLANAATIAKLRATTQQPRIGLATLSLTFQTIQYIL